MFRSDRHVYFQKRYKGEWKCFDLTDMFIFRKVTRENGNVHNQKRYKGDSLVHHQKRYKGDSHVHHQKRYKGDSHVHH